MLVRLFFGANDIQNDQQLGGLAARARQPQGPFEDYLGKPLIDRFHNGAQPIDQFVFKDRDGSYYIVHGGWRHCNIARLNADFTGFVPFPDGTTFKEITPQGYVEGAFMLWKDGSTTSCGRKAAGRVRITPWACAIGASPFGPFERVGRILQQDPSVATGAGHHPSAGPEVRKAASSITAGRSARPTAIIGSCASTSFVSTRRIHPSGRDHQGRCARRSRSRRPVAWRQTSSSL